MARNIQREDYTDLLKKSLQGIVNVEIDREHVDLALDDAKKLVGFELLNLSKKTKKLAKRLLN